MEGASLWPQRPAPLAQHHSPDTGADQQMLFNEAEVLSAIEAADTAHANRTTEDRRARARAYRRAQGHPERVSAQRYSARYR